MPPCFLSCPCFAASSAPPTPHPIPRPLCSHPVLPRCSLPPYHDTSWLIPPCRLAFLARCRTGDCPALLPPLNAPCASPVPCLAPRFVSLPTAWIERLCLPHSRHCHSRGAASLPQPPARPSNAASPPLPQRGTAQLLSVRGEARPVPLGGTPCALHRPSSAHRFLHCICHVWSLVIPVQCVDLPLACVSQ